MCYLNSFEYAPCLWFVAMMALLKIAINHYNIWENGELMALIFLIKHFPLSVLTLYIKNIRFREIFQNNFSRNEKIF